MTDRPDDARDPRPAQEGRKGNAPEHTEPEREPPTEGEDATDDYANRRRQTDEDAE